AVVRPGPDSETGENVVVRHIGRRVVRIGRRFRETPDPQIGSLLVPEAAEYRAFVAKQWVKLAVWFINEAQLEIQAVGAGVGLRVSRPEQGGPAAGARLRRLMKRGRDVNLQQPAETGPVGRAGQTLRGRPRGHGLTEGDVTAADVVTVPRHHYD